MKSIILCLLLGAVYVLAQDLPVIPCTFTSQVDLYASYAGKMFHYKYTHYSIEGSMIAQEGLVPDGNTLFSSKHVTKKDKFYMATAMFDDHYACVIFPGDLEGQCMGVAEGSKLESRDIPCPNNNSSARCDRYIKHDGILTDTWYFLKDSSIPVQHEYDGEYYELYNFITFDTATPSTDIFEPPKGAICNDLSNSPTVKLDIRSSHFLGSPLVSASRDIEDERTMINDRARIAKINAQAKTWKAGPSKFFDGVTKEQATRQLLSPLTTAKPYGHHFAASAPHKRDMGVKGGDIPEYFDASKQWPNCGISDIRNQAGCGSCWAFGSTESLGDRFCIARNDTTPLKLSPQFAVECFDHAYGCQGGFTDVVWMDLKDIGAVTESCLNYLGFPEQCSTKCDDGAPMDKYKAASAYPLYTLGNSKMTMEQIQRDVMENGPVEAAFWVFDDFYNYNSGVYQHTPTAKLKGGHAVKIYGWGVENQIPYWLVANSWGPEWGDNGSFRILRGHNECSFEDAVAAGLPLVN